MCICTIQSSYTVQVFPAHYHPQFISFLSHHQRATSSSSRRRHHETHSITTEEEDENERYYGGGTKFRGDIGARVFHGYTVWEQRWKCLSKRVDRFDPGHQQGLNFAGSSSCLPPTSPTQNGSDGNRRGRGVRKERERGMYAIESIAWYEEPSMRAMTELSFEMPYISNLGKAVTTSLHSSSAGESHSPSTQRNQGETGTGSPQHRFDYFTSSILPPAPLDVVSGKNWKVVYVSVLVGRVVVYCGESEEEETCGLGCLTVNSIPVKAVVVYQTTGMSYSVTK